jgi:hypothetical protein
MEGEMHTKGNWNARIQKVKNDKGVIVNGAGFNVFHKGDPIDMTEANANLIAAAPDLLNGLKLLLELSERNDYETYRKAVKEIATDAINKAEGK